MSDEDVLKNMYPKFFRGKKWFLVDGIEELKICSDLEQ